MKRYYIGPWSVGPEPRDPHPAFGYHPGHHPGKLAIFLAIILADYATIQPIRMICMLSSYMICMLSSYLLGRLQKPAYVDISCLEN